MSELYNQSPGWRPAIALLHDEQLPIQHGCFYWDDAYPDSHLLMDGEWLRSQYDPDFLLIHPMGGGRCRPQVWPRFPPVPQSRRAAWTACWPILLPQWLAEGYQVVITSDHGMNNDLSHGGTLPERARGAALAVWRCLRRALAGWGGDRPDPALRPDGRPAGVPHDKPVAPRCSGLPLCARCADDACNHRILVDQPVATKHKVRRHWLPALVLLPFVLLMILFQLAPHGVGAGGQLSDPGWLGPRLLPGDFELPFYLQSFGNSLRIAENHRQSGGACHPGTLGAAALPTAASGSNGCCWPLSP